MPSESFSRDSGSDTARPSSRWDPLTSSPGLPSASHEGVFPVGTGRCSHAALPAPAARRGARRPQSALRKLQRRSCRDRPRSRSSRAGARAGRRRRAGGGLGRGTRGHPPPSPPPSDGPCPAALRPGPAAGCEMAAGRSRGLLWLWLLAAAAGLTAGRAPSCHEVRTAFQLRQIGPLKLVPDVPTAGQYRPHPGAAVRGLRAARIFPGSHSGPASERCRLWPEGGSPGLAGLGAPLGTRFYTIPGEAERESERAAKRLGVCSLQVFLADRHWKHRTFSFPSPLAPLRFFRATAILLLSSSRRILTGIIS